MHKQKKCLFRYIKLEDLEKNIIYYHQPLIILTLCHACNNCYLDKWPSVLLASIILLNCTISFSSTCPILTYLGMCHEVCQHGGSCDDRAAVGGGRLGSWVGWGGRCWWWGGGALGYSANPGLYAGMALKRSGCDASLTKQWALILRSWRGVCE